MSKQVTVKSENGNVRVILNDVDDKATLTSNMARRAARIAFGELATCSVTVTDGNIDLRVYRLYRRNRVAKVKEL